MEERRVLAIPFDRERRGKHLIDPGARNATLGDGFPGVPGEVVMDAVRGIMTHAYEVSLRPISFQQSTASFYEGRDRTPFEIRNPPISNFESRISNCRISNR
jgi:hypothetical protein